MFIDEVGGNSDQMTTLATPSAITFAGNHRSPIMTRSAATALLSCFLPVLLLAQAADQPPADFLRSIGKMYVVVAVIVVVFLGLAYYLWSLDRRLTKLEDQTDDYA